jgi:hypothetical protein
MVILVNGSESHANILRTCDSKKMVLITHHGTTQLDPADGRIMVLQKVCSRLPDYTASHSNVYSHHRENLKPSFTQFVEKNE